MEETSTDQMDQDIATLRAHADEWAKLPLKEKIAMGERLIQGTYDVAERQVARAIEAKRIPKGSPLVGE